MVLGPAPPLWDGTQRRKHKGREEASEGNTERGRIGRMRMCESSLTLEALMSDLALQLKGHFREPADRQQGPELIYLFPLSISHTSLASILLPPSLSISPSS